MDNSTTEIPFYKVQLSALFMIAVIQGIADAYVGPSLDDFQCVYNVDIQQVALLFPVYAASKIIGSLFYLLLKDCQREYLQMTIASLLAGVCAGVLGVWQEFWGAVLTIGGIGFFFGLMNSIGTVKSGELAKENVLPYHLWCFGFTTGNVIGPLIMYPFLRSENDHISYNESVPNATISIYHNCTGSNIVNGLFLLTASFIVVAFGFLLLHFCLINKGIQTKTNKEIPENNPSYWQKGWPTFLFATISLMTGFLVGTANVVYSNLLSTFGIHSEIQEDASTMALMTSSFSTVTFIGRFSSMFLSYILSQRCLFLTSLLGVLGSAVLLVYVGEISTVSLWAGSSLLALFYAPVYGSLLGWSENTVPLTSTFMILMTGCDNTGLSVLSLIIGQLMAIYTVNMLNVSFVVVGVIQLANFGCMYILSKYIPPNAKGYSCLDETNNN